MSLFTSLKNAGNTSVQFGGGIHYHSQNIANANNPDYHRVEVKFNYTGHSLRLSTSGRAADNGLTRELLLQNGTAGESQTINDYMRFISQSFGLDQNEPYLSDAIQQFEQSWRDFQANPDLESTKLLVVEAGKNLAQTIQRLSFALNEARTAATQNIESDIREANRLMREIGRLNARISNATAQKQDSSLLQNERDAALHKLSGIISIQLSTTEAGIINVHTRSGNLLVAGGNAKSFSYDGAANEIRISDSDRPLASNDLNRLPNGSLSAHFDMLRDGANTLSSDDNVGFIAKYELMLDDLVTTITDTLDPLGNSFNQAFERNSGMPPFTFFTANADRFSIAVNDGLVDGTLTLDKETVQTTTDEDNILFVLNQETRIINNADLTPLLHQEASTYKDLINGILTFAAQTVNSYDEVSTSDIAVRDNLKEELVNRVGVNADEELATIQQLQTSYAANAKIIETINRMFQDLLAAI